MNELLTIDQAAEERKKLFEALEIAEFAKQKKAYNSIDYIFNNYEQYPKHMEFFKAGAKHKERVFIAANRVGKSVAGAYEMTCHLTGEYPSWWEGKRFNRPVKCWAAGDTGKTTRDILQSKLLGSPDDIGSGLIRKRLISKLMQKVGVADAYEIVYVEHKSGGQSMLNFKSYDQRREGFQGTEVDVVWLDEECPVDIYTESLLRTMTTKGIIYLTFTPLHGLSELVLSFMPNGQIPEQELT